MGFPLWETCYLKLVISHLSISVSFLENLTGRRFRSSGGLEKKIKKWKKRVLKKFLSRDSNRFRRPEWSRNLASHAFQWGKSTKIGRNPGPTKLSKSGRYEFRKKPPITEGVNNKMPETGDSIFTK